LSCCSTVRQAGMGKAWGSFGGPPSTGGCREPLDLRHSAPLTTSRRRRRRGLGTPPHTASAVLAGEMGVGGAEGIPLRAAAPHSPWPSSTRSCRCCGIDPCVQSLYTYAEEENHFAGSAVRSRHQITLHADRAPTDRGYAINGCLVRQCATELLARQAVLCSVAQHRRQSRLAAVALRPEIDIFVYCRRAQIWG
jgi:hypothetical protein